MGDSKRRGWGEGSIYQQGNRWVASVTVSSAGGVQVRRKRTARTQPEARTKLRELQNEVASGIDPAKLTVGLHLDKWLKRKRREGKSPTTIEGYEWAIEGYIKPTIGGLALRELGADHVDAILEKMMADGMSQSSMTRVRSVLNMAITDAVRRRLKDWNPVAVTTTPSVDEVTVASLTRQQAQALMAQVKGDRLEALWTVLFLSALRPGEAPGLVWDDIDFDKGVIHVRHARIQDSKGMRLGDTKTKGSVRDIEAPTVVMTALKRHKQRQDRERRAAGKAWQSDPDLVFSTTVGTFLDRHNILRSLRQLTEAAGIGDDWDVKQLRHSCISLLSDEHVHIENLADLAGHATTRTTEKFYRHPVRPTVGGEAKKVTQRMFGSGRSKSI